MHSSKSRQVKLQQTSVTKYTPEAEHWPDYASTLQKQRRWMKFLICRFRDNKHSPLLAVADGNLRAWEGRIRIVQRVIILISTKDKAIMMSKDN